MTTTLLPTSCPPRFGTQRSPERLTLGPAVGKVARLLGKPFMPHQQYVADVILEIDPATGLLAYQEWIILLPRQEGKSTFVEAKATHRCTATGFFGPRQRVVYTAQTRKKALEKWEEDFRPDLEASSYFRNRFHPHKPPGNEHFRFTNGSRWGLEAATETAGHGSTIDEAYLDESFAHQDWRLEQALGPAMITRLNKQLGVISTAGWLNGSPYLEAKVAAGRAAVEEGRRSVRAYFEWSAPKDADPGDEAAWWACMPALGQTISVGAIRAEYEKALDQGTLNEFRRAYLNQWVPKNVADSWMVIPRDTWQALADPDSQISGPVAFAVAVDGSAGRRGSIGVAGWRPDGLLHVELADYRPGASWMVQRLVELTQRYPGSSVVVDEQSHEGSLIQPLEQAGVPVTKPGSRNVAIAFGQFYEAAMDAGTLRHLSQPELDSAVAAAVTREVGDAGRTWGRRAAAEDISPVVAVTLAAWAAGKGPQPFFGSWQ